MHTSILQSDALVVCSPEATLSWLHPTLSSLGISSWFCHERQDFINAVSNTEHRYKLIIWHRAEDTMSHHECCRLVREHDAQAIVLVIAAEHQESEHILCLELGASDYLAENYSPAELKARLRAHVARTQSIAKHYTENTTPSGQDQRNIIRCRELEIDIDRRNVTLGDKTITLTAKEFDLLHVLASRPGQVFTRDQLLDRVWGQDSESYAHTVSTHINRLRSKIDVLGSNTPFIQTLWGVGYKFCDLGSQE